MKKYFLLAVISSLIISTSSFARSPASEKCPKASAIKAAGLTYALRVDDSKYQVGLTAHYFNTDQLWSFNINAFAAESAEDAFKQADAALSTLHFEAQTENDKHEISCLYHISLGSGLAIAKSLSR